MKHTHCYFKQISEIFLKKICTKFHVKKTFQTFLDDDYDDDDDGAAGGGGGGLAGILMLLVDSFEH